MSQKRATHGIAHRSDRAYTEQHTEPMNETKYNTSYNLDTIQRKHHHNRQNNTVTMTTRLFTALVLLPMTIACTTKKAEIISAEEHIERVSNALTSDTLTPETMWNMGRIGTPVVSPDGSTLVFTITYTDITEDKNYTDIYTMPTMGGELRRVTSTKANEAQPAWLPDGSAITYLSAESGTTQVWKISPDGNGEERLTDISEGIDMYSFAPDMAQLLYVKRVKLDSDIKDIHPDLPKANARIENDLMYRHWNAWSDGSYNHIFVTPYAEGKMSTDGMDIMQGEKYHSPLMPFGGLEQICWSPDALSIAYTCKKLTGMASAQSTNSDIYLYHIPTGEVKNLTEGNMGYDINPSFSADGKHMYYLSMEREGYESDINRLMVLDMTNGTRRDLTSATELTVNSYTIDNDGKSLWFVADHHAKDNIYHADIATAKVTQHTLDMCNYTSVTATNERLIATRMSMSAPTEIYTIDKATGESKPLTNVNKPILDKLCMGDIEERWIETTDGKKMLTWVIYPPRFDKSKKYPAILYCQGGPQSTVSQFWSLRWNMQLMASNGYIVVAPNRRGLPGFGKEWNEQISGDYGGQNMKDYLTAIDTLAAEPYVDEEHLGAVGASYGGFSIYWLAGNHEKRFKTFISHCGIFNFEQMYATTEELFFINWDLKGAFWEYDNPAAMKSFKASPHLYVNNWDTPIMVIHGEKDFRIPYTQGLAAFNTAKMKGLEARLLYYPDECHWVNKPQNSILWHREFKKWLDRWLKEQP